MSCRVSYSFTGIFVRNNCRIAISLEFRPTYFERAELEAWLRRNLVKTQVQIEAEAQQYVLRSSKKK